MSFIKKIFEKRKITKQLIKTYELGDFATIENALAKLCKEHEDIAIYFFRYFNATYSYISIDDFYKSVMASKKIVLSNRILRSSIYNKFLYTYFQSHKDDLTKEQIISILEENFNSYYSRYASDLYMIMRYALYDPEYFDTFCSLFIKFPKYESATDIRLAMSMSGNYSEEMVDAMIATNNLEELKELKSDLVKAKGYPVPDKLNDKIKELEDEERKYINYAKMAKRAEKLKKSQAKLDETIQKL